MMGLAVLLFFAVYLLVSIWTVNKTVGWAKANDRKPWRWGGLAAFAMCDLVFWDWIPTLIAHKYYCSTQAGFWVYKTPEQWKAEHPDLSPSDLIVYGKTFNEMPSEVLNAGTSNAVGIRKINKKLYKAFDIKPIHTILPVEIQLTYFADIGTKTKLAELKDIRSGYGNPMTIGDLQGLKEWLSRSGCDKNYMKYEHVKYKQFFQKIIELGEPK